ncbi:MAG: hemolysin family protein [Planctomycetaceae bacterium]|nr:hemolysin family protein [Planctomycetaceae bacterium]
MFAGWAWELVVIFLLILLNGFFAAAEIAILTARRGRLQQLADEGDGAAQVALDLARDSDRFLPTVQVGITLVSTLAAVFGGARVEENLAAWLATIPVAWIVAHNHSIAFTVVVLGLAFFSLILGELVPKRVALQNAEPFARIVAYPMLLLQRITRPVIWFLQTVTVLVLRLLRMKPGVEQGVSVEDIQHLIDAGGESGLLADYEHRMAMEALRLGDRTVTEILRPRVDIDAIDIDTPSDEVIGAIAMSGFSRVPVCEGDIDHIVGFVYIKDVFLQQYLSRPIDLRRLVRPPLFVPQTLTISRLLEQFQTHRTQLAIVLDEYGGTQGMVTLEDVFEMLVGDIHDEHRQDHSQRLVRRDDGSWLVDGAANLHELQEALAITRWFEPPPRAVGTVAGLILGLLKRPPHIGDKLSWSGLTLEVVDMDGPRIDRVLVTPTSDESEPDAEPVEPS